MVLDALMPLANPINGILYSSLAIQLDFQTHLTHLAKVLSEEESWTGKGALLALALRHISFLIAVELD